MKKFFMCAVAILAGYALVQSAPLVVDTVHARITLNGNNFIPIFVWVQPSGQFAYWKSKGVNTTIGVEDAGWAAGLLSTGMYGVPDRANSSVNNTNVIAYFIHDEPDIEQGGVQPRNDTNTVKTWASSLRSQRPTYPLMINFAGTTLLYQVSEANYRAYCRTADLVCQDLYPIMEDQSAVNTYEIGAATDKLMKYVDYKKPVAAFIETGRINGGARGPTAGELRAQIWLAMGAGCKYIGYFTVAFDPWLYNNLQGNTAQEQQFAWSNQLITQMTDVLMEDRINLTGFRRTFIGSAVQSNQYYRRHNNDLYVFMISVRGEAAKFKLEFANTQSTAAEVMGESRTLTYSSGAIVDSFTTTATSHVYKIANYFQYNTGVNRRPASSAWPIVLPGMALSRQGTFDVAFNLDAPRNVSWDLFNLQGRRITAGAPVLRERGAGHVSVPCSQLDSGVYFVRMNIDNEQFLLQGVVR